MGSLFTLRPQVLLSEDQQQDLDELGWDYFRVIVGPAAGPRNFISMGLDHHISARAGSPGITWLAGGSFAALRHCAMITSSIQPATSPSATEALLQGFARMVYQPGDTAETLTPMMRQLFHTVAPDPTAILRHPHFRLAVFVTSMCPWTHHIPEWLLQAMFYVLLGANIVSSSVLQSLQRRLCFYTGPEPPPFLDPQEVTCIPLTEDNLYQVLHATTCVPFYSEKCSFISGCGQGNFMDGALGDYVLNFASSAPDMPVLVLSMDCDDTPLKKNIWDTFVPWRHATEDMLQNVTVLSPTQTYREQLVGKTLPSTWDFFSKEYIHNPEKRVLAWLHAYHLSLRGIPDHPSLLLSPPPVGTHPGHVALYPVTSRHSHSGGVGVHREDSTESTALPDPATQPEDPQPTWVAHTAGSQRVPARTGSWLEYLSDVVGRLWGSSGGYAKVSGQVDGEDQQADQWPAARHVRLEAVQRRWGHESQHGTWPLHDSAPTVAHWHAAHGHAGHEC